MRKQYLFLALLLGPLLALAQHVEPCGIRHYTQQKIADDFAYQQGMDRAEMSAQKWIHQNRGNLKAVGDKITIPVVFHVVYNEDSLHQNLDEAILLQQLEILNRDYNRDNKDTIFTRAVFDTIATDTKIIFELASTDPDGNPTNGITRTATTATGFDIFPLGGGTVPLDAIKSTEDGGIDSWDTEKYLNIWIGRLTVFGGEGLYGIATFPLDMAEEEGGNPNAEPSLQGATVHYPTVGYNVQGEDTLFRGRTLAHEVGHYLGLRHIWADEQDPFSGEPGDCTEDDFVYDTPMAAASANFECNTDINYCGNENEFSNNYWGELDPPDMIENFMDYATEECQNMFSYGQFERSMGFLNTSRKGLWFENENGAEQDDFKAWLYTETATVPCLEDCNGQIIVNFENETGNLAYTLDGESVTGPVIENVCQGIHTVTVTDDGGNTKTLRTYVSGFYKAPVFESEATDASCGNCEDGSATVTIDSGNEPITVTWQTTPPITGNTLENLNPGTYYYTVEDGCGESYLDSVQVGNATGIATLAQEAFQLAPNPVSNVLTVRGNYINRITGVTITTVSGSVVYQHSQENFGSEIRVNTEALTGGFYILQLTDATGSSKSYRFVKR